MTKPCGRTLQLKHFARKLVREVLEKLTQQNVFKQINIEGTHATVRRKLGRTVTKIREIIYVLVFFSVIEN